MDFDYSSLQRQSHRPWPVPRSPWIMTQSWHDLLFAHWPMEAHELRQKVPASLPLDLFGDQAWLTITPFHMTNVSPRGVPPLPWISAFPELNVRTYVRIGDRPGVFFFSLDAARRLAVFAARTMFHLPYFLAAMEVRARDGFVHYMSRRKASGARPATFVGHYRPTGPAIEPARDTLEYFLTERYCLYTVDKSLRAYRVEIHHAPWPLQPAEAQIEVNTMADAAGIQLPARTPLLHFARRQDVIVFPPKQV